EARIGAAAMDPKDVDGAACVDLAEHFLKGAKGKRALRYLDAALTYLERNHRNDAVIHLLERALSVNGLIEGGERVELLARESLRLDFLGRRETQLAAARQALDLARELGDAKARTDALRAIGRAFHATSRFEEARMAAEEAVETARTCGDLRAEIGAR